MGYTFFEFIDFWNIFEFKNDFKKSIDVGDMLQTTLKKKKSSAIYERNINSINLFILN